MFKKKPKLMSSAANVGAALSRAADLYPQFEAAIAASGSDLAVLEFRRNELLHCAGQVTEAIFLPLHGTVRRHFMNEFDKDVTCQLYCLGDPVVLWASVVDATPSKYMLSAVDACTMLCLPWRKVVDSGLAQSAAFHALMLRDMAKNAQRYDSLLGSSPSDRFARMLARKPDMAHGLPKHVLASYLGITTVHLGRIRTQFGVGPGFDRTANRGAMSA